MHDTSKQFVLRPVSKPSITTLMRILAATSQDPNIRKAAALIASGSAIDSPIRLDLQYDLKIHSQDQVGDVFRPGLSVQSPAVDCLGRPIKRPNAPEQIQLLTGHVNQGKTRIAYWR